MDEFNTLISSVGFPIAACIALFYLYNKTVTELTVTLTRIEGTMTELVHEIKKGGENEPAQV